MEEECEFRRWDELIPDALALIFKNLSLPEILTVVPRVCKSWERAVKGPYCWQEIDIEEWSRRCRSEDLDQILQMLITRSGSSLRKLCVSGLLSDSSFTFIAEHGKSLHTLRLPSSGISDSIVNNIAERLSALTFLDVSYCKNIGAHALETIGNCCKFLTGLRRTMHPLDLINKLSQDDEAIAIAGTMPKLKQLEMAYLLISTESVLRILANCKELELLDVQGCWNVKLDDKVVKRYPGLKVVGPVVTDCCGTNGWDVCSNYSGSSRYLAWDFVTGGIDDYDDESSDGAWDDDDDDDDESIENVEMRFYDDFDVDNAGSDWPQSP
ncbi:hypothetical protein L1049_025233 [Liquidambar formosana]|uniref:F-box domain-containing protein n=1 Tax=Liquidambar formosana TaxID=63359 RepID=A0AAP0X5R3_LIQFO